MTLVTCTLVGSGSRAGGGGRGCRCGEARGRRRSDRCLLLGSERVGNCCRWGNRGERGPWVCHGRVVRRLGAGLGLLAVAVNVFISCTVEAQSAKLDSGAVHIPVAGHANSLFLVENAPRVARGAHGRPVSGLDGGGSVAAAGSLGLVLLLSGRDRRAGSSKSRRARVP